MIMTTERRSLESIAAHERSLTVSPGYVERLVNFGMDLLRFGDYRRGWPFYELRHQHPGFPSLMAGIESRRWTGIENFFEKAVLL